MTTITTTTAMPAGPSQQPGPSLASRGYAQALEFLEGARDREIAAQVLDQMTGEATSLAALALEDADPAQHLSWTETAAWLNLLACAMRGYAPEFPDPDANSGWARERWLDLAAASGPAEFAVLFADLAAALQRAAGGDTGSWAHGEAVSRLATAGEALSRAPWVPLSTIRLARPARAGDTAQ